MGYEVVLYITRDEDTENFFHRFQKVEINGRLWEVQMVNDITSETMLIIYLKETFTNEFEPVPNNAAAVSADGSSEVEDDDTRVMIEGPDSAYPFDELEYKIKNTDNGIWLLSNSKAKINNQTNTDITITIVTAKSGSIDLIYRRNGEEDIVKTISIQSL